MTIQDFIDKNIYLIDGEDWDTLADNCPQDLLKDLIIYLRLADITPNFTVIEYPSDTWVATYYSGTSSIISTIEVKQLSDINLSDGDKINVAVPGKRGPTTIIYKDNKYLDFARYQLNDVKSVSRLVNKKRKILEREKEAEELSQMVESFLKKHSISFNKVRDYWFEIYVPSITIHINYDTNQGYHEANLGIYLNDPFKYMYAGYSEVKSKGLDDIMANFIADANREKNINIKLF